MTLARGQRVVYTSSFAAVSGPRPAGHVITEVRRHGLQLQCPVQSPCCSCKLTRGATSSRRRTGRGPGRTCRRST